MKIMIPRNMLLRMMFAGFLAMLLAACGGGGGSSSTATAQLGSGGTTGGGGNSGGGSGGGSSGGGGGGQTGGVGAITSGGLIPGGARFAIGSGLTGVSFDVASGGTGASFVFGDIQEFGSVILNDTTVNTDNAVILVEGAVGSQSDLKQGQQVLVIGDAGGGSANSVHYRANVKGPVTAVVLIDAALGTATFDVLGQRVITDATTAFADVSLTDITVGDLLEISGTLSSTGDIQASYVERQATLAEYKVTGPVSNVTSTDFTLGNLVVDYASAALQDFDGPIANEDIVEVKGAPSDFTAPDRLIATRVESLPLLTVGTSVPVRVEGFVNRFVSPAEFEIQTTPITTDANTVFSNGSEASLGLNVKVQVEGAVDANGVVLAQQLTIQPTDAVRAEGPAEFIDIAARAVTVLGVEFAIRDQTRFEDDSSAELSPFALSDIAIGDELEIRGYLDGSSVVATRVEREDAADRARLRGPVTAENAAAGTLTILSVEILSQSGVTEFQDSNDTQVSQAQFYDLVELGTFVKSDWDVFVSTTEVADELSIEDE